MDRTLMGLLTKGEVQNEPPVREPVLLGDRLHVREVNRFHQALQDLREKEKPVASVRKHQPTAFERLVEWFNN